MSKRSLYILSVLLIVGGVAASAVFIFQSYSKMGKEMQQVEMPGTATLEFDDSGKYTFYHEFHSVVDGEKIYTEDIDPDEYRFSLKNQDTGDEAVLLKLDGKQSYSFRDREGRTIFEAEIKEPGTYILDAEKTGSASEGNGDRFVVTVDRGFLVQRITSILGGQAIMLIPAFLALIIFIYAYTRKEEG